MTSEERRQGLVDDIFTTAGNPLDTDTSTAVRKGFEDAYINKHIDDAYAGDEPNE